MDYERKLMIHIIAFLLIVPMTFCSLLIPMFSDIEFDIEGFAVDPAGRVYVHYSDSAIYVYQAGEYLYNYAEMNDMPDYIDSRARFIITEKGEFWMQARGVFYAMDLKGNLLRTSPGTAYTSEIYGHDGVYEDSQGNIYRMKGSAFGRTRIVKNDAEVVHAISTASFALKILRIISAASVFPLVISFLYMIFKEKQVFSDWF